MSGRPASAKEVMDRIAELRYQQAWRESRSELAAAIARAVPLGEPPSRPAPVRSATERTNHPLTLVTRSLLLDRGRSPVEQVTPSVSSPSPNIVVSEALMALSAGRELPRAADLVSLGEPWSAPAVESTSAS
ncbi:MAG TPA: hypothetical protein PKU97_13835, partial [Kofleriaceae bacterium]|nr:hypothetical protein [Kofleriaceae bacterium]